MSATNTTGGEFAGKAVIVTGSSGGIGRAAAIAFAKLGAAVTIHGQNEAKLHETRALLKKEAGLGDDKIVCVLGPIEEAETARQLIEKTIQAFGRIDVLVNNAGIGQKPGEEDIHSLVNYDYLFNVNVRAVIQLTQLAIPHLAKTEGNIVMISSGLSLKATKAHMYYGMTKAALDHYTRDMANLVGQAHKIRVNGINPGLIATDFRSRHGVDYNKLAAAVAPNTIAKRAGDVEEIAEVITFVASPRASYIWGANLLADGGAVNYTAR